MKQRWTSRQQGVPDVDRIRRRDFLALLGGAATWTTSVTCAKTGHAGHRLSLPGVARAIRQPAQSFPRRTWRNRLRRRPQCRNRLSMGRRTVQAIAALAADLVARNVDVIVAPGGAPVALAAKAATTSKTIVFEMGGDPVQLGVVDSLSRPGGNITGVSSLSVDVSPKRLELMHELLPTAAKLAVVANPTSPTANSQLQNLRSAAEILGVHLQVLNASSEKEFEPVFSAVGSGTGRRTCLHLGPLLCVSQWAACRARPAISRARNHPIP